jgi:hypothetical protein
MKFVFPALWIPGFGFGAFILWFGLARGKHGELPPAALKYAFAIIWVLGTTFILWIAIRLKRVRLDGTNLYVSKWFREITVPFIEIASVTESKWIKGHPILIHFKNTSTCGRSVMFMPKLRLGFWSRHPIVAELRQIAGLSPDSTA